MKLKPKLSYCLTALVLLSLVIATGCGANDPSSTVKNFYAAVEKGDAKAMERYATPETAELLTVFGDKARANSRDRGGIKSATHTINGNNAVVDLTFENGATEKVNLIKVDGKWKVTAAKN